MVVEDDRLVYDPQTKECLEIKVNELVPYDVEQANPENVGERYEDHNGIS